MQCRTLMEALWTSSQYSDSQAKQQHTSQRVELIKSISSQNSLTERKLGGCVRKPPQGGQISPEVSLRTPRHNEHSLCAAQTTQTHIHAIVLLSHT